VSREGHGAPATPPATLTVDARGLRCPLPVIRLAQSAAGRPAGTVLELWATDPAARADVPAWCRMRGHELVDVTESGAAQGGHTAYTVRLRGPAAP
jgi:TusA-related sulfurtransferase